MKGEHHRGYEQQRKCTLVTLCLFIFCLSHACLSFRLPHAGYGGGTTTRRMVATTTGREDNIAEESTLAILPLLSLCCLPHAGYGGGTTTRRTVATTTGREDNIAEESMLPILPICCFLISLLSPTCWLWWRDNDEEDGGKTLT